MTPKPMKKPPLTQAEKNGGRYAAEVAAAKRDGWEGRSAALTAWGKGEGNMIPHALYLRLMAFLMQVDEKGKEGE